MHRWIILLVLLLLSLPVTAQQGREDRPPRPDAFNLSYGELNRHRLDLYLPEGDAAVPVVLMIHGGGYFAGSKTIMGPLAADLRLRGYAVVVPNYRLAPFDPYPAPINDLACALAWTHAHAEDYHFDTERVVVLGESAGGNAALLLGAHDNLETHLDDCPHPAPTNTDWAQAVVAYYPIVDLSSCLGEPVCAGARRAMALYLDVTTYTPDLLGAANPLSQLDADDAPVLLIHGTVDFVVPPSESELYAARLADVGIVHELLLIDGANHAFAYEMDLDEAQQAVTAVDGWLAALWE